jgi:O-Antigen ligase
LSQKSQFMNAVRSGQSIDKKTPLRFGVVPAAGCVAALIAGWFIVSYDNPLTATLIVAAITIFVLAILNPKAGFYLLILATGYVDLVKRLGILAGDLTYSDVVVTLAVAPILFACICIGVVLQYVFEHKRLQRWQYAILVVVALLMAPVLLKDMLGGSGMLAGLQDFANSGAYFPLMLIAGILFPKTEDVKQLVKFCLIIYIPVALYAIWQQIFGLSDFEINYLRTGYTITVDLLDDVRPRPFSTLNSPHALTVVTAIMALLAFFVRLKGAKREAWQIPVGIVFTAACIASVSRAGWALLALGVIGWICFRRTWTTIGFYGLVTGFLVLLIVNADPLLDSLDTIQQKLPDGSAFTEQTFRVETFSDRLYSFRNMVTNPVFHTWFGNPELREHKGGETVAHDELAHDQLTQILVQYGFVGLSGFLFLAVGALWLTHRKVLAQRNHETRETAIALLAVLAAVLYSGMLFGSHLAVFPVNVFFAFLVGCLLMCCISPKETAASALEVG